jgi:alkylated DNA repair dioxygenase AlkB
VKTPRWQQAYGEDYYYSGHVNKALPIPPVMTPLLHWARAQIDPRLNGILLNWYDGKLSHYIGRHRDSTVKLYPGGPIVTISLGEERIFRLRPWRSQHTAQEVDFTALDGTVFVMPFQTNAAWTHEVPAFRKWQPPNLCHFSAFALNRRNRPTCLIQLLNQRKSL